MLLLPSCVLGPLTVQAYPSTFQKTTCPLKVSGYRSEGSETFSKVQELLGQKVQD